MADRDLVCKVCGREFTPFATRRKEIVTKSGRHYDTFDCPRCGCQVVVQERIVPGQDDIFKERSSENRTSDSSMWSVLKHIEQLEYKTRSSAAQVLEWLKSIIKTYGVVTVADYYTFAVQGEGKISYAANIYGWINLDNALIELNSEGKYTLKLPKPLPLR